MGEYFKKTVVSSYHYFGTAAHGSVVEGADFKVKGTDNLHVVDASVIPDPTRVNPQGTIMAMGHHRVPFGKPEATKTTQRSAHLRSEGLSWSEEPAKDLDNLHTISWQNNLCFFGN